MTLYGVGRNSKRLLKQFANRFSTGIGHVGLAWLINQRSAFSEMGVHHTWHTIHGALVTEAPPSPAVLSCAARQPPADQDAYQVCRQWTIAVFQHISENEFSERLVGGSARYLGSAAHNFFFDDANENSTVDARRQAHRLSAMEIIVRSRYLARMSGSYDARTNAGADVVFSTVANQAFYSALPSIVDLRDDSYGIIDEVCGTWRFP